MLVGLCSPESSFDYERRRWVPGWLFSRFNLDEYYLFYLRCVGGQRRRIPRLLVKVVFPLAFSLFFLSSLLFLFFTLLLTSSKRKTHPFRRHNHYTGASSTISTSVRENGERAGVFSRICRNDGYCQLSWSNDVYQWQYKRNSDELREVW